MSISSHNLYSKNLSAGHGVFHPSTRSKLPSVADLMLNFPINDICFYEVPLEPEF